MASVEQKKADENVLRLVEEQKVLQLERLLDAKQKLEMEYEELKGKLQVKKHLGDEEHDAVQKAIKDMKDELESKIDEEPKKEKQEALNKILQLEKLLDAKQKLEMEYEELKGKMLFRRQ